MQLAKRLLALPPCLLMLLSNLAAPASSQELEWPYNLPAGMRYYPEDEVHIKRDLEIRQRLQYQQPVGVRKMSSDPHEKFFLDYWSFESDDHERNIALWTNSSLRHSYEPACPLHSEEKDAAPQILPRVFRLGGRSIFDKRDFACPTGTSACTNIQKPNSCCASGSICVSIPDTGLGDVGCCPDGENCGGELTACASGYTSCPSSLGGGCCVPGYGCFDVGCVQTSTAVVTISASPAATSTAATSIKYFYTTVTMTVIIPYSATSSSTTVVIAPTPLTTPSTTRSTLSKTLSTSAGPLTTNVTVTVYTSLTSTIHSNPSTSVSGFHTCPKSIGGGYCPVSQICASGGICLNPSSSASYVPPVKPTSDTTTTTRSSILSVGCPTGFYACSAYFRGGCCQTGADCHSTSCKPTVSTNPITISDGVTVEVPTGSDVTYANLLTGSCGTGWFSCARTEGGGCCPTGYACGASCSATAMGSTGSVIAKEAPNGAWRFGTCRAVGWILTLAFAVSLVSMLF